MMRIYSLGSILSFCSTLLLAGSARTAPQPHFSKTLVSGRKAEVKDLAFSPDGHVLYVATDSGLIVKETQTGKTLSTFWIPRGWLELSDIEVSADGRYLVAIATTEDKDRILIWNRKTGQFIMALKAKDTQTFALSPDNRWLAVSDYHGEDDGRIRLIETGTWITRKTIECGLPPTEIAFSNGSKRLAGHNYYGDAGIGDLQIWNVPTGKEILYNDYVPDGPLHFLPGGNTIAVGNGLFSANIPNREEDFELTKAQRIFPKSSASRWVATPYISRSSLFVVKKLTPEGYGKPQKEELELWDLPRKRRLARWNLHYKDLQHYKCSQAGRWLAVWGWGIMKINLYRIK